MPDCRVRMFDVANHMISIQQEQFTSRNIDALQEKLQDLHLVEAALPQVQRGQFRPWDVKHGFPPQQTLRHPQRIEGSSAKNREFSHIEIFFPWWDTGIIRCDGQVDFLEKWGGIEADATMECREEVVRHGEREGFGAFEMRDNEFPKKLVFVVRE